MPPRAPPATHLGESILDLVKGARVCREQLLLEGVLDDVRDGCPPQLLGVREPHVDDCKMAAESWSVLLEPVEDGVVCQHDPERRQALVKVVEVVDERTHLMIPNRIPARLGGPPRAAGRQGCESGCRHLSNEGPVDRRDHVCSMMVGLGEVKGLPAHDGSWEPDRDQGSDVASSASIGRIVATPELPPSASRVTRFPWSPSASQLVGDVGASPMRREVPVPARRDAAMSFCASEPVSAVSFHAGNATPSSCRLIGCAASRSTPKLTFRSIRRGR